jgi:hypothetical protein
MIFKMSASERWDQYKRDVNKYVNEVDHLRSKAYKTDDIRDTIKVGIILAGIFGVIILVFACIFFIYGWQNKLIFEFAVSVVGIIICLCLGLLVIRANMMVVNKSNKSFKDNDIQDIWDNHLNVIMANKLFPLDTDYQNVDDIQIRIK